VTCENCEHPVVDLVVYVCSLQQGYECTRRFLTEFITSPSSDDSTQLENHCSNNCSTAADSEQIARDEVQSTLNQSLHDKLLGKLPTSCNGLSSSITASAFVDTEPDDDDFVPWRIASQHSEVSFGLHPSYSEASVIETQVWHHSVACQPTLVMYALVVVLSCNLSCNVFVISVPDGVESCFVKVENDFLLGSHSHYNTQGLVGGWVSHLLCGIILVIGTHDIMLWMFGVIRHHKYSWNIFQMTA